MHKDRKKLPITEGSYSRGPLLTDTRLMVLAIQEKLTENPYKVLMISPRVLIIEYIGLSVPLCSLESGSNFKCDLDS